MMVTAGGGSSIGERGSLLLSTPGPGIYGALGEKNSRFLRWLLGKHV